MGVISLDLLERAGLPAEAPADVFQWQKWASAAPPDPPDPTTDYEGAITAVPPLVRYKLDEAPGATVMADSSGNGRHADYLGTVALGVPGAPSTNSTGMQLDGAGWGSVESASWMDVDHATAAIWFKTSSTARLSLLTRWGSANSSEVMALDLDTTTTARAYARLGGSVRIATAMVAGLRDNNWHHAVMRADGVTLDLFIDGAKVASVAGPGTMQDGIGSTPIGWRVGSRYVSPSSHFVGVLDDAVIWGSALTDEQVTAIYTAGPTPEPEPEPEPTYGWSVDEDRSPALHSWTVTGGRQDMSSRVQAVAATVTLARDVLQVVPELGERFRLAIDADLAAALGIYESAAVRFTGAVTDVTIDHDTGLVTVIGVGRRARIDSIPVDASYWPPRLDHQYMLRVWDAALEHMPDLERGSFSIGTYELASPDEPSTLGDLIDNAVVSTGGQLVERRTGVIDWHGNDWRRRDLVPELTLDASQILNDLTWTKRIGDLLNLVDVDWSGGTVRAADPYSIDAHDPRATQVGSVLVDQADAHSLAALIVSRRAAPFWQLPALQVDAMRTVLAEQLRDLLWIEHSDRIRATGLPDDGGFTDSDLYVEGVTEQLTSRAWRFALAVSDPALSGITVRWMDLPETLTWAGVDPNLTWLDLGRIEDPTDLEA